MIIAFLGYHFLPEWTIQSGGIGGQPLTTKHLFFLYITVSGFWFIYKMRKHPPYDIMWNILLIFIIVLTGRLLTGYVKYKFKEKD